MRTSQVSGSSIRLQPCYIWDGWPSEFVLPDFAGAWFQVLDDLFALAVEARLLHSYQVLLDMALA